MNPTPEEIMAEALALKPVAMYVGFSGGRDSLACTHWVMARYPQARVMHLNTGIGVEASRQYVRDTCARYGWPLDEVRAKEDCGQDYEAFVRKFGFPGPQGHFMMYARLKERPLELLLRRAKVGHKRSACVAFISGVRYDESLRRMRYANSQWRKHRGQLWINPIYWWAKHERDDYIARHNLPINPVAQALGMSGECLCGAFAQMGEKARIRAVDPEVAARIDRLEQEALALGFTWNWEGHPPRGGHSKRQGQLFMPLCVGCEKSAVVQAELEAS